MRELVIADLRALSLFGGAEWERNGGAFMVEIVGLGFWVFGHGNCFVNRWVWVMVVVGVNQGGG